MNHDWIECGDGCFECTQCNAKIIVTGTIPDGPERKAALAFLDGCAGECELPTIEVSAEIR